LLFQGPPGPQGPPVSTATIYSWRFFLSYISITWWFVNFEYWFQ